MGYPSFHPVLALRHTRDRLMLRTEEPAIENTGIIVLSWRVTAEGLSIAGTHLDRVPHMVPVPGAESGSPTVHCSGLVKSTVPSRQARSSIMWASPPAGRSNGVNPTNRPAQLAETRFECLIVVKPFV